MVRIELLFRSDERVGKEVRQYYVEYRNSAARAAAATHGERKRYARHRATQLRNFPTRRACLRAAVPEARTTCQISKSVCGHDAMVDLGSRKTSRVLARSRAVRESVFPGHPPSRVRSTRPITARRSFRRSSNPSILVRGSVRRSGANVDTTVPWRPLFRRRRSRSSAGCSTQSTRMGLVS